MNNLALNKLPLEKKNWKRPEEATNGNFTAYDGGKGFAHALWPCSYTLDLGAETKIDTIRFLIWDDLGRPNNRSNPNVKANSRKYKFSLSISSDNETYFTVFSNENQEGGNGWFSFSFANDAYVRFVRLNGHFNTANKEFHIVEFEIYDQKPNKLKSTNTEIFTIPTTIPGEKRISEIIDQTISEKSKVFEGIEDKVDLLNQSLNQSSQALSQIEFIKQTHDFLKESVGNNNRAKFWLYSSTAAFIIFLFALWWFSFKDNYSMDLIIKASEDIHIKPYTNVLLSAYYVSKALFLSTILFVLGWFLKNYRSEKHNYVMNKHKAISLTVATGILTKDNYKSANREIVFNQGMEIIFTHQTSGFSKDDGTSPSIVNTLLNKGMPGLNT